MLRCALILVTLVISLRTFAADTNSVLVTTMNCYFFFGGGVTSKKFDQPKTAEDYWKKAVNLGALLPADAPLLIGLQEIGLGREVTNFARVVAGKYKCGYEPVFVKGRDTFTDQNVAALMRLNTGWGLNTKPVRDPELDRALSKHLVLQLTNATSAMEVCVVHLRRAIGYGGPEKQRAQNEALALWVTKRLQQNPKANLVVLGDFNETKPVGDPNQSMAVLVEDGAPLRDTFQFASRKYRTHANGRAYDRILISDALAKGTAGLKFESVFVREHDKGKGNDRLFYTDHFPVTMQVSPARN